MHFYFTSSQPILTITEIGVLLAFIMTILILVVFTKYENFYTL